MLEQLGAFNYSTGRSALFQWQPCTGSPAVSRRQRIFSMLIHLTEPSTASASAGLSREDITRMSAHSFWSSRLTSIAEA